MSTRYIVDAEGRPVEAILDIEEYRAVLEARRKLEEATRGLAKAGREISGLADATGYREVLEKYRRTLDMAVHAQGTLSEAVRDLEGLEEVLEDLEAIRAHDADTEMLERGEGDLVPWDEAKREIEQERVELRRRGEL